MKNLPPTDIWGGGGGGEILHLVRNFIGTMWLAVNHLKQRNLANWDTLKCFTKSLSEVLTPPNVFIIISTHITKSHFLHCKPQQKSIPNFQLLNFVRYLILIRSDEFKSLRKELSYYAFQVVGKKIADNTENTNPPAREQNQDSEFDTGTHS